MPARAAQSLQRHNTLDAGAITPDQPSRLVTDHTMGCYSAGMRRTFFLASMSEAPAAVGLELPVVDAGIFVS